MSAPPRLGRIPALDGMRAVAVLLVMVFHAVGSDFSGGRAGVDVFFVLSGFLITALLLEEREANGSISLRKFYMRRVLRLYPALIVAIVGALVLAAARIPIFDARSDALSETAKAAPFTLLYTINIVRAVGASGGGYLGHAWSLAIEEQFYLLWPLMVIVLFRRRGEVAIGWVALGCAIASALSRTVLDLAGFRSEMLYNATFSHVDGIFLGCALAVLWRRRPELVRRYSGPHFSLAAVVIAAVVIGWGEHMNEYGFAVVVIATTVVLADIVSNRESSYSERLSHPAAVAIGRRSYGLYLYHWPIFLFLGIDTRPHVLALGFGGSFAAAWISYRWIEQPLLAKKGHWASDLVRATTPALP